ncbi:hypothetical protein [Halorussus aquaticus]|uniref:Uncharacterized protein n=1 Tax=Halorussus aquaticus TaxID=2953748 RepID=A0ABD5Q8W1_9EURY|nr:hypothetical protein [Halorussus aquaticus]
MLFVIILTGILLWTLPRPGYSQSRLILFSAIIGGAWIGIIGVAVISFNYKIGLSITAIGTGTLFILGFWQAAIGFIIMPTAALILLAAYLSYENEY